MARSIDALYRFPTGNVPNSSRPSWKRALHWKRRLPPSGRRYWRSSRWEFTITSWHWGVTPYSPCKSRRASKPPCTRKYLSGACSKLPRWLNWPRSLLTCKRGKGRLISQPPARIRVRPTRCKYLLYGWGKRVDSEPLPSSLNPSGCPQSVNGEGDPIMIVGGCHPIGSGLHLRGCVAHGNTEGDQAQHGDVIVSIANRHHICWRDPKLLPLYHASPQ